jgi:hypothetical protein
MCDKCAELDGQIVRCERIAGFINDRLTIDRIKGLVEQMKAQKVALHHEQESEARNLWR